MRIFLFLLLCIINTTTATAQWNFYYGNIHAHSAYSDGNQDSLTTLHTTPAQDYAYANTSLNFDFLGISDHNHNTAGMTIAEYQAGLAQANTATNAGFVALYGMEYGFSSANLGHILVYGIDSLIGWQTGHFQIFNASNNYTSLYGLINARPNAVASLAHPQIGDYSNLDGTAYAAVADQAISGLSVRSGYAFSTTTDYTDNPATLYETYFQTLLSKGYHVAPSIDHDNHNTTFGRTLEGRTIVLANALSKTELLSAIKNMRYYASDDWNAQVLFTGNGNIMGSEADITDNPQLSVNITDAEPTSKIEVFMGTPGSGVLPVVVSTANNVNVHNYIHVLANGQTRYFYAKITQTDGDLIWTAPVWLKRVAMNFPVELLQFEANVGENDVLLDWSAIITDHGNWHVERSIDGLRFEMIGTLAVAPSQEAAAFQFRDTQAPRGVLFYRLRQISADGTAQTSRIVSVYLDRSLLSAVVVAPNPTRDQVRCSFNTDTEIPLQWAFFDSDGRRIKMGSIETIGGANTLEIDASDMPSGNYWLTIGQPGWKMVEEKVVVVR